MKTFIEFITENVDKIDVKGNEIKVVNNPSTDQIKGLLKKAKGEPIRWSTIGDKMHVWHGDAIHADVYNGLHGGNYFDYKYVRDNNPHYMSGVFFNSPENEHFSIGYGSGTTTEKIENNPRFSHILPHPDGGTRNIEKFST